MRRATVLLMGLAAGCGSAAEESAPVDDAAVETAPSEDTTPEATDAPDAASESSADAPVAIESGPADATPDSKPAPKDTNPDTIPWQTGADVGFGVARKDTTNWRGNNVFIAYAGKGVGLAAAEKWATALYLASLRDRGVRYLYAVQGPADVTYTGKEIGNSKIVSSLLGEIVPSTHYILVAGHSSGSYVAHELLGQLAGGLDPKGETFKRVVYFDLDGGTLDLSGTIIARLRKAYFVGSSNAENGTISPNDGDMRSAAMTYAPDGASYHHNLAVASGCDPGAIWCVHVTLVTTKPHDPAGANGNLDYSDFAGRPVAHGWLDAKATEAGIFP